MTVSIVRRVIIVFILITSFCIFSYFKEWKYIVCWFKILFDENFLYESLNNNTKYVKISFMRMKTNSSIFFVILFFFFCKYYKIKFIFFFFNIFLFKIIALFFFFFQAWPNCVKYSELDPSIIIVFRIPIQFRIAVVPLRQNDTCILGFHARCTKSDKAYVW